MSAYRDNAAARRYELEEDGAITVAEYREVGGALAITHVETPEAARGKGTAKRLMDAVVAEARESGLKLIARCPYAVSYFERFPGQTDVLASTS